MRRQALETALLDERPAISGVVLLSAVLAEAVLVLCILLVISLYRVSFPSSGYPAEDSLAGARDTNVSSPAPFVREERLARTKGW